MGMTDKGKPTETAPVRAYIYTMKAPGGGTSKIIVDRYGLNSEWFDMTEDRRMNHVMSAFSAWLVESKFGNADSMAALGSITRHETS